MSETVALRAGELRHKITIQAKGARVDDGYGGGSIPEIEFANLHAKVEPLTGGERFELAQFDPSVTHRVTIRYIEGIKTSMRVLYGTRTFDIKFVRDVDERHRKMELLCEELPSQ